MSTTQSFAAVSALTLAFSASASAQQTQQAAPAPGSPAATITIPGDQLPPPPQKFGGKIERDARDSKPYWPSRVVPPKGAPNVLLIITDDAGYGVASTFGGVSQADVFAAFAAYADDEIGRVIQSIQDMGKLDNTSIIYIERDNGTSAEGTPWPKDLTEWDSLSWDEKKLFIKQADIYGAYLAYADHEIGRVIQAVEDLGELDNTLIIYIGGDNGASAEGMLNGTPNEFTTFNGIHVPVKDQLLWYPFWGSERTFPHFAAGWAWTIDTPFTWVANANTASRHTTQYFEMLACRDRT